MKQLFLSIAFVLIGLTATAQSVTPEQQQNVSNTVEQRDLSITLEQLRDMSNRMDRQEFLTEALQYDSLLKNTSSREWLHALRIADADSLTLECMPTLYDIVVQNLIYKLSGKEKDSLRNAWADFHAGDKNMLARAYVYSSYPTYEHLNRYRSLPDCWERGLLLRYNPGSAYDKEVLPLLEKYIAKYPDSPIIGPIQARRDRILQMEVNSRMDGRYTTADSLRIDFSVTNAHKVVFRLYEIDKKVIAKNLRKYGDKGLKYLRVLDSCVVSIPASERPFEVRDLSCAFAPQAPGYYFVYVTLPEDTLQSREPWYENTHDVEVSDLCVFSYSEPTMVKTRGKCHVVATDALSGLPIRGAQVKGTNGWGINALRYTDKDGHASYRVGRKQYQTTYRVKKRNYPEQEDQVYGLNQDEGYSHLSTYANATIFRPGDTIRLTTIYSRQEMDQRILGEGAEVRFTLRDQRWKNILDTTIHADPMGAACLTYVIPSDFKRGSYNIGLYAKKVKSSGVYGSFHFSVEDYRLPTFSLVLSEENLQMRLTDTVFSIRGAAMQFSGLPLSNQQIEGEIYYEYDVLLFSCQTAFNGSFSYELPDSIVEMLEEDKTLRVRIKATSADGETHEQYQYIHIRGDKKEQPKEETVKTHTIYDLWPKSQQLWSPQDSLIYSRDSVSVLLGVRGEAPEKGVLATTTANPVYVIVASKKRLVMQEWKVLHQGLNRMSFALPKDTDEYLDIRFVTTVHGKVHDTSVRAIAPLRTEIKLVPQTFRNYLNPGTEEEWVFQLRDQQGKPVAGRLLCTMIDEAVHNLSPVYYHPLLATWSREYLRYSTVYNNTSHNTLQSTLPGRPGFMIDKLPLSEPYRAPGDTSFVIMVNGYVEDANGEPVIGASINVAGTSYGTVSNYDGLFSITATANSQLIVSFIGMQTVTLPVQPRMTIVLQEDTETMEEVFCMGYGQPGSNSNVRIYGVNSVSDNMTMKASYSGSTAVSKTLAGEVAGVAVASPVEYFALEENEEEMDLQSSALGTAPRIQEQLNQITVREGDTRLALYEPGLDSDQEGIIRYRFRAPLDNTTWHLSGLAWGKNGASCTIDTLLTARRTLMAHLTAPRFLRQGDKVVLPCLIRNTADSLRHITVSADLLAPGSDSLIYSSLVDTSVVASGELMLLLPCQTSTATADSLVARLRVIGRDGSSDGEQRLLPVLPIVEPIRESVPFYMHPSDTALTLMIPSLPADATDAQLVLTYCANPLAYLFDGLPSKVDTSFVTPLPLAHYLFTLAVSNHLAEQNPGYREPADLTDLVKALRKFQRANGGFSWLADSRSWTSAYITEEFVYLMGELSEITTLPEDLQRMTKRAIHFLDRTYSERITSAEEVAKKHKRIVNYANYSTYAWVRSYFQDVDFEDDGQRCYALILEAMPRTTDLLEAPYQALCLHRAGREKEAKHLINYLRDRATTSAELGMYFNNLPKYHHWFSVCEQQANYLRAFAAVDPREEEVEALRQWLLLSRQTTRWGQSSLSAYAAAALLQTGDEWLAEVPSSNRQMISSDTIPYSEAFASERFSVGNGQLTIHADDSAGRPAWGSVTAVYRAPLTSVQPYAQPAMSVSRTYVLVVEEKEQVLSEQTVLQKGDRVRVKLTLKTDREMDGIILRDNKPATLEPVSAVSRFVWEPMTDGKRSVIWSGVLSYQQFLNEAVELYIEHLPRGTYSHSYDCYVTTSGTTVSGLATSTCELAPEFNAHSAVATFVVE